MERNVSKRSLDSISKSSVFLIILCISPLAFLFAFYGDPGRGLAAAGGAGMIALAVKYFWDLRKHAWFWITIALITSSHVALVLFIRWPDRSYRGIQLLPLGVLDFAIIFGIIRLAENIFQKGE